MHPLPCHWSTDPLTLSIGQGIAPIQTHRPFERPPGATSANPMQESPILEHGFRLQNPTHHLKPCRPESRYSSPSDPWIWILKGNHHPMDASP